MSETVVDRCEELQRAVISRAQRITEEVARTGDLAAALAARAPEATDRASCEGCGAKGVAGKHGGTFWLCEPECPVAHAAVIAARREADAALVALVNAVPAWANPNAWRAAVLAVHEASVGQSTPDAWRAAECERAIGIMVAVGCAADAWSEIEQIALDAYRRAIAPHKAPPPERATWKARGLRLTVDDGRDE